MAFKFRWLCDLLQKLEQNRASKACAASRTVDPDLRVIVTWFNKHHAHIPRHGDGAVAFLSCLFPERRPDRVYNLQRKRLASMFGRSLGLGIGRMKELNSWQESGGTDFPQCVETAMARAEFEEPAPGHELTLEEVNQALDELAARSPFSSPTIRSYRDPREAHHILGFLLHRLQSWEAKWLVRIILKNFCPVIVPEKLAMDQYHFLLRDLLDLQNSVHAVVTILSRAGISQLPSRPAMDCQAALKLRIMDELVPQVGVMVKRPSYQQARNIKHCCQMAANRQMSLERKYDGEYCQIHIDLTGGGNDCITIFSKSGKDSTADRVRLHGILKDCLGISTAGGRIAKNCILEGELLVWNNKIQAIEPFHKIRKHVQRSGRWLGNQADSPASLHEHLMIMFYDILLLDNSMVLREPHGERRRRLEALVKVAPGYAEIGTRETINFSSRRAPEQLRAAFAAGITRHWEGFVLKGCDDPYIPMNGASRYIKLKKDYITGLGDTLDLAIVGGHRDPKAEQELRLGNLSWTSFYVACLENKAEVQRFDVKPVYRIVNVVGRHNISNDDILFLNEHGKFVQVPFATGTEELEVQMDQGSMIRPTELFKQAFLAEVYGAGFEKPAGTKSLTLRFPRVRKIHSDRPASEAVSFDELQQLGRASYQAPVDDDSQKDREWIERLEKADPKSLYIVDKSIGTSPGRSFGSVTTARPNVAADMRTKLRSPVLVRADTSELAPTELSQQEQTDSSRLFYSQSTDHERRGSSKRELPSGDATPEANSRSKRLKVSQADQDLDQPKIPSSPCKHGTAHVGLKTASLSRSAELLEPQGTESISPTAAHLRSVVTLKLTSSFREPLADITNSTPDRTRQPMAPVLEHSVDRARERASPELGPASILREGLQEALSTKTEGPRLTRNAAVVPNPPTSSPAVADVKAHCGATLKSLEAAPSRSTQKQSNLNVHARGQRHSPHRLACARVAASLQSDLQHGQPPHPKATTISPASRPAHRFLSTLPIFLSESLAHLSTHPARPLEARLRAAPFSFTYSLTYLLSTLPPSASSQTHHVALVDSARPDAVAQEMRRILQQLKKMVATDTCTRNGRILFLDWNALCNLGSGAADTGTTVNDLKQHFGGCLAWKAKTTGDGHEDLRNIFIEPIWSWHGAMTFGTWTKGAAPREN
jgi:DNA ligase-4